MRCKVWFNLCSSKICKAHHLVYERCPAQCLGVGYRAAEKTRDRGTNIWDFIYPSLPKTLDIIKSKNQEDKIGGPHLEYVLLKKCPKLKRRSRAAVDNVPFRKIFVRWGL